LSLCHKLQISNFYFFTTFMVKRHWYFKLRLFGLTEFIVWHMTLGCKDIGIKNQSLWFKLSSFTLVWRYLRSESLAIFSEYFNFFVKRFKVFYCVFLKDLRIIIFKKKNNLNNLKNLVMSVIRKYCIWSVQTKFKNTLQEKGN